MVGVIWLFLLPTTFGFLFELTTPGSLNGEITNSRYNALLDIIIEERKERKQIEQYIGQLEMEVKKLTNITSKIPIILKDFEILHSELHTVQSKSTQFENCCSYYRNSTSKITMTMLNRIRNDIMVLEDKQTKESKQVAVTACATGDRYNNNSVIRFPNIRTSYGINTLTTLQTNGKFTCDKPGLYLIIASIMTHLSDAEYQIRKNENNLVYVRIVPRFSGDQIENHHTGTGSAVVFLSLRDTIDIHAVTDIYIHVGYSCLSIFRIH